MPAGQLRPIPAAGTVPEFRDRFRTLVPSLSTGQAAAETDETAVVEAVAVAGESLDRLGPPTTGIGVEMTGPQLPQDWDAEDHRRYRLTLEALKSVDEGRTFIHDEVLAHVAAQKRQRRAQV